MYAVCQVCGAHMVVFNQEMLFGVIVLFVQFLAASVKERLFIRDLVNVCFEGMLQHRRSPLDGALRAMTARNCTKRTITPCLSTSPGNSHLGSQSLTREHTLAADLSSPCKRSTECPPAKNANDRNGLLTDFSRQCGSACVPRLTG